MKYLIGKIEYKSFDAELSLNGRIVSSNGFEVCTNKYMKS